jgi:fructan beta-fructosidase
MQIPKVILALVMSAALLSDKIPVFASSPKPIVVSGDIVFNEFEGAGYGDWKTTGTAFGTGPALGQEVPRLGISGERGNGVASSELFGGSPEGTLTSPAFLIQREYISFVISGGDNEHATCLNLIVGGKVVLSETGRNNDELMPVTWDVGKYRGLRAVLQLQDEATGSWGHINVDHIVQTNNPEVAPVAVQPLYKETFRPQFHFTARQWTENRLNPEPRDEGWCNDLNGLVYYDGEYHLFAQRWNKCWIHAVSRDLVHWTELQPAFWEESNESGAQSGNCVIDYGDTSGLSQNKSNPPMVAFWARGDQKSQCISYSLDHGRTWQYYAHNPVMVYPERDPMVFWYKPTHKWVMMLYGNDQYHIFTSDNLLKWKDEDNPIPNSFECPDFFQLPIDGNKDNLKWVLVRGNGKYSVGTFDGTKFTEETPQMESDAGPNFYATQSWGNTDTGDGRRIQCAWMRGGVYPDMPFNQQITFPCELTLHTTPDGLRLFRQPIKEIALLHTHENTWSNVTLRSGGNLTLARTGGCRAAGRGGLPGSGDLTLARTGDLFHVKMSVSIPQGSTVTMNIRGVPLVLTHNTIACGTDPQPVIGELKTVEILIDRTSIEIFANQGELSLSRCFLPDDSSLSLKADGLPVSIHSILLYLLKSAWPADTEDIVAPKAPH